MSSAANDTACRHLLVNTQTKNSSSLLQCSSCLSAGCAWCRRDSYPFCWSGTVSDLSNSKNLHYTTCPSANVAYSSSRSLTEIQTLCQQDNTISAGAVAAIILWLLILFCCIGACCCAVLYFAYNRGKTYGAVHIDGEDGLYPSRGGHYIASAYPRPPGGGDSVVQMGVLVPAGGAIHRADNTNEAQHMSEYCHDIPIAVAEPIHY